MALNEDLETRHKGNKPLPRLRHIEPGQFFTLRHDLTPRILLHKSKHHGHFNNGYASLCHELDYSCVVWGENGWEAKVDTHT